MLKGGTDIHLTEPVRRRNRVDVTGVEGAAVVGTGLDVTGLLHLTHFPFELRQLVT